MGRAEVDCTPPWKWTLARLKAGERVTMKPNDLATFQHAIAHHHPGRLELRVSIEGGVATVEQVEDVA
jgi:hypothetical protein